NAAGDDGLEETVGLDLGREVEERPLFLWLILIPLVVQHRLQVRVHGPEARDVREYLGSSASRCASARRARHAGCAWRAWHAWPDGHRRSLERPYVGLRPTPPLSTRATPRGGARPPPSPPPPPP